MPRKQARGPKVQRVRPRISAPGRRVQFGMTLLVELIDAAMASDEPDQLETCVLLLREVASRFERQTQTVAAKLSNAPKGISGKERKELTERLAWLQLLQSAARDREDKIARDLADVSGLATRSTRAPN